MVPQRENDTNDLKVSPPRSVIDCQVTVPGVPSVRKCSSRPGSFSLASEDQWGEPKGLSEIPRTLIFSACQGSVLGGEGHLSTLCSCYSVPWCDCKDSIVVVSPPWQGVWIPCEAELRGRHTGADSKSPLTVYHLSLKIRFSCHLFFWHSTWSELTWCKVLKIVHRSSFFYNPKKPYPLPPPSLGCRVWKTSSHTWLKNNSEWNFEGILRLHEMCSIQQCS